MNEYSAEKKELGDTKDLTIYNELMQDLKIANTKLVASENVKSNFLSNIRNEINNPLAAVLELSRNISSGEMNAEQVKKFANLIHSEIFSLDFQLRNIFFSAEIEAGESALSVVSTNVATMIQNVINSFQHQIEKKNLILFTVNNISSNNLFFTDAEKLHLVVSNLISNAIQFSHEGGKIKLSYSIKENQLVFSVSDEGCGISSQDKDLVFDRFRQADEGSTKNYGGHGLGLSITKALLDIINGTITVESSEGNGSIFTVVVNESESMSEFDKVTSNDGNDFLFNDVDAFTF